MNALERIEAALARLEIAAHDIKDLRDRHDRLKGSVSRSLDAIDELIARPEG